MLLSETVLFPRISQAAKEASEHFAEDIHSSDESGCSEVATRVFAQKTIGLAKEFRRYTKEWSSRGPSGRLMQRLCKAIHQEEYLAEVTALSALLETRELSVVMAYMLIYAQLSEGGTEDGVRLQSVEQSYVRPAGEIGMLERQIIWRATAERLSKAKQEMLPDCGSLTNRYFEGSVLESLRTVPEELSELEARYLLNAKLLAVVSLAIYFRVSEVKID